MSKFLLLVVAIVIASAVAEDTLFGQDVQQIEDVNPLDNLNAAEIFLAIQAKSTSTERVSYREELVSLWAENNLDMEPIDDQEMIETKTKGSGYQEMGPIMKKVDELEKNIKAKMTKADADQNTNMEQCRKNLTAIDVNITRCAIRVKKHQANIKNRDAQIKVSKGNKTVCSERINRFNKQTEAVKAQRGLDFSAYKNRKDKRMNEIRTLKKALGLVCTFTEFLKSTVCVKEVNGRELNKMEATTDDPIKTEEAVKKADAAIKADEEKYEKMLKDNAKAIEEGKMTIPDVVKVGFEYTTAEDLLGMSTEQVKEHRAAKAAELENMLSEEDSVSMDVAKPIRLLLVYTKGEVAKEDPNSLPPLLWDLLTRITSEMKQEAADVLKLLKQYSSQLDDLTKSILEEVNKQKAENNNQISFIKSIENSQNSITIARNERDVQSKNKATESKRCINVTNIYRGEQSRRRGELRNMDELRSLLRVLQNSDLPKCEADCTAATQGKCIWQGMMGKDSYCRCKPEFYGKACELKKCPGSIGLLRHDQRGVCNDRGTCDNKTGSCTCRLPYFSGSKSACELKHCPDKTDKCNGPSNGKCNTASGVCECTSRHYGSVCQYKKCPGRNSTYWVAHDRSNSCYGYRQGACNSSTGVCACGSRNYGTSCQYHRCPYNCNGRGACNAGNGQCSCYTHYTGTYCQARTCPNNCRGRGACLPNGVCRCNSSHYVGNDCRTPGYDHHTNYRAMYNNGYMRWWYCPSGYLMNGMHKWGYSILGWHYFQCVRPADENSSSYYRYTANNGSYCMNANWWGSFDHAGWSQCPGNRWLSGLRKNSCNNLYCIEEARCCSISGARWGSCGHYNWSGYMNSMSSAPALPRGMFLTGFYRRSGWGYGINGIVYASGCYYKH